MEDNIVSNLLTYLYELLASELNFRLRVEEQVRLINNELQNMIKFLNNSAGNHNQDKDVMLLVDQIRDVACQVDHIVDTYVVNVAKERRRNEVAKFFHRLKKATMLHNVREQIDKLKTIIAEIYGNYEKYKTPQNVNVMEESHMLDSLQERRKEVEENDVVGFDKEVETLVYQLVEGTKELDVISISGMGGLGKTTLAKKVYNDQKVKEHFEDDRAWVNVSQKFNLKELLLEIFKIVISTITDEISKMSEEQLKQELKKKLSHRTYLVVLDDIWNTNDWDSLKKVFPNTKNGSRVFVTTRHAQIAHYVSNGKDPPDLQFLNADESWELFTKKVFPGGSCPTDLESLGRKITDKCGGLPLAIVELGGLLARKDKNYNSWNVVLGSVNLMIAQDTKCLEILGLSYSNLPPYLQRCFLYLGLFPEDYKIPASQLIQLWISEGFIHEDSRTFTEAVAKDYLQRLIDRSLIQVEERRSDGSEAKNCRVHRLIRLLCIKLSKNERLFECHSTVSPPKTGPRRLSIDCSPRVYISNAESSNTCHVRTLLCFKEDKRVFCEPHWGSLFQSFKLLRVLDLGNEKVYSIPQTIDQLVHLKYLRVKTFDIARIPATIFALDQLQTLDLRTCRANVMPQGIWGMHQLRHLYLDGRTRLPKNIGNRRLSNLQTLCYISKDHTGGVHIAESAPNLRKLGLYGYMCNSTNEQDFTFNLPYLESLKFANECTFKSLIKLPSTVTKITIRSAKLGPKTMEMFQNLSKLRILKLDEASFEDDELVFQNGWFPELQLLKIENSNIVRWKLEEGAVPKLKRLVINDCPRLTSPPEELRKINLEELKLSRLPESFTEAIGEAVEVTLRS